MAENPATWGRAEHIIDKTITEHYEAMLRGICGWSLPRKIANELYEAGLLKEDTGAEPELADDEDQIPTRPVARPVPRQG